MTTATVPAPLLPEALVAPGLGLDRANPMLVRYVRQQLRSRGFIAMFSTTLALALLASLFAGADADARPEGQEGAELLGVLSAVWAFALWVFEPIAAYRAVTTERDDDTWDLIRLTGMRPGRLLRGMLLASAVQAGMYSAAIAPFVVMAYLLRGIDLLTVGVVVLSVPLIGICGSATGIWMACLGPGKASRAVLGVLFGLGCAMVWASSLGFWFQPADLLRFVVRNLLDEWVPLTIMATLALGWVGLMLASASALIQPVAADRSSAPRLALFAWWLGGLGWAVGLGWADDDLDDTLSVFAMMGVLGSLLLGAFGISENYVLSARQRLEMERSRFFRRGIFGSGAARGRLAFLIMAAASLGAGLLGFVAENPGWTNDGPIVGYAWFGFSYGAGIFLLSDALSRGPFRKLVRRPRDRRVLTLLLLTVLVFGSALLRALLDDWQGGFGLFSPFSGPALLMESSRFEWAAAIVSAIGLGAVVVFVYQAIRGWSGGPDLSPSDHP
jgi:hypothetical protein